MELVLTLHELHPSPCRIPQQEPDAEFLVEINEKWSPSSWFYLSGPFPNVLARCCQQPIMHPSPVMDSSAFHAWSAPLLPNSSSFQDLNLLTHFLSY